MKYCCTVLQDTVVTLVRYSGVYMRPRGPEGGFSGVYFPVKAPANMHHLELQNINEVLWISRTMVDLIPSKRRQEEKNSFSGNLKVSF